MCVVGLVVTVGDNEACWVYIACYLNLVDGGWGTELTEELMATILPGVPHSMLNCQGQARLHMSLR